MIPRVEAKNNFLDRLAIGFSALCFLHCLFLPVFLLLFPTLGLTFFGDESFHKMLLFVIIPLSMLALFMGCKKHNKKHILSYGFSGMAVLVVAATWAHDALGETGEVALTALGTLIISYAHIQNQRLCVSKNCKDC